MRDEDSADMKINIMVIMGYAAEANGKWLVWWGLQSTVATPGSKLVYFSLERGCIQFRSLAAEKKHG